jgi:hypothetical protein
MEDLIEALKILLRYGNPRNPTHCEHDVLTIAGICPDCVTHEDQERLKELGFIVDRDEGAFKSYRFGSA